MRSRSSVGLGVLPSSVSCEGKPYVDDRGKRREGGSPGNCGASRRRANEDYKGRDDPQYRDEEEISPINQGEPERLCMEP